MDQSTSKQEETEGVEQPHSSSQMSFPKIEASEPKVEEDRFQSLLRFSGRLRVEESSWIVISYELTIFWKDGIYMKMEFRNVDIAA